MKSLIFILVLGICCSSCEQEFSLGSDDFERSIVVNAIFECESDIVVTLSYSKSILDTGDDFERIESAEVMLSYNEDELVLTHIGQGQYANLEGYTYAHNAHYTLEVFVPGHQKIEAKTYLPKKAKVTVTSLDESDEGLFLDFVIEDDVSVENYYLWEIIVPDEESAVFRPRTNPTYSDWFFEYENTQDVVNVTVGDRGSKIWLADRDFINNTYSTSVVAAEGGSTNTIIVGQGGSSNNSSGDTLTQPKPYLRVLTVSKELFEYYQSLEEYYQNGPTNSSYSTPYQVYSNIDNGLGIFAAYSETVVELN